MAVCAHNRDFEERDEELVSLLCEAYSIELQKTKYLDFSQSLMHQSFLFDLLNGKFEDEGLIIERLKILGLKFKSKLFVINIDIQNLDKSKSTLPYMRDEIENKLVNAKAIVYNQNVVVLASCENDRKFLEIELGALKEFIVSNNLQAGISRPFLKLANVRGHYLESMEALKLGKLINKEQNFYKYEDYLIIDLLNKNSNADNCKRYIHHSLLRLIEYDKENGTDYVHSFYIYLCNFKNTKESAAILNIHRNTLFHRMEKIEQLLNVDLNDGNVMFQLYLSYKILEFLRIPLP